MENFIKPLATVVLAVLLILISYVISFEAAVLVSLAGIWIET